MLPIVKEVRMDLISKQLYFPITASSLYDAYKGEWKSRWTSFKDSLKHISNEELKKANVILPFEIDNIVCQQDSIYQNWIFDENYCTLLKDREEKPTDLLTVSAGGTIPCALYQIFRYYGEDISLDSILEMLCYNGYRIHGKGVLWQTLDVLLPLYYGIDTNIPQSFTELIEGLQNGNPIFCLVPANWGQGLPVTSNQALIIWGIQDEMFLCTNTYQRAIVSYNAVDLLLHLSMAWSLSK